MNTKNKILGIFNIIDILIILVIVAAGFVGYKVVFAQKVESVSKQETFIMKFYTEEVPNYVVDAMEIGGQVEDEVKNIGLGRVIDFTVSDGYMFVPNANGEVIKAPKENYSSLEIVSEVQGELYNNGAIVKGNKYGVGHSFTIRAGKAKMYLKVSGIERLDINDR